MHSLPHNLFLRILGAAEASQNPTHCDCKLCYMGLILAPKCLNSAYIGGKILVVSRNPASAGAAFWLWWLENARNCETQFVVVVLVAMILGVLVVLVVVVVLGPQPVELLEGGASKAFEFKV